MAQIEVAGRIPLVLQNSLVDRDARWISSGHMADRYDPATQTVPRELVAANSVSSETSTWGTSSATGYDPSRGYTDTDDDASRDD